MWEAYLITFLLRVLWPFPLLFLSSRKLIYFRSRNVNRRTISLLSKITWSQHFDILLENYKEIFALREFPVQWHQSSVALHHHQPLLHKARSSQGTEDVVNIFFEAVAVVNRLAFQPNVSVKQTFLRIKQNGAQKVE